MLVLSAALLTRLLGLTQVSVGGEHELGLPVFEVVVRRNAATGELEQQPVALFSGMDDLQASHTGLQASFAV